MTTPPRSLVGLGLGLDADERAVRKAYALRLKSIDLRESPEAFQELRRDFEEAIAWVRLRAQSALPDSHQAPIRPSSPVERAEPLPKKPSESSIRSMGLAQAERASAEFLEVYPAGPDTPLEERRKEVLSNLEACLDDPCFIPIGTRDILERRIAEHLVKPEVLDRDALLHAACVYFEWKQDVRRLSRLGAVGEVLAKFITLMPWKEREVKAYQTERRPFFTPAQVKAQIDVLMETSLWVGIFLYVIKEFLVTGSAMGLLDSSMGNTSKALHLCLRAAVCLTAAIWIGQKTTRAFCKGGARLPVIYGLGGGAVTVVVTALILGILEWGIHLGTPCQIPAFTWMTWGYPFTLALPVFHLLAFRSQIAI